MKCRNRLSNARFIRPILRNQDTSLPAAQLYLERRTYRNSLAWKWEMDNPLIQRLSRKDDKSIKTEIKDIRYESVVLEDLGYTGVSDAIAVDKSLKHSVSHSILGWIGRHQDQARTHTMEIRSHSNSSSLRTMSTTAVEETRCALIRGWGLLNRSLSRHWNTTCQYHYWRRSQHQPYQRIQGNLETSLWSNSRHSKDLSASTRRYLEMCFILEKF